VTPVLEILADEGRSKPLTGLFALKNQHHAHLIEKLRRTTWYLWRTSEDLGQSVLREVVKRCRQAEGQGQLARQINNED
jgi:hypothetical protein